MRYPKDHKYPIFLIMIALEIILSTSCGFRATQKILAIFNKYYHFSKKSPNAVTILNWSKKFGCYQLQKPKEKADDWVVILDESIEFGHDKLLNVYGVRQSKIDPNRALKYKDLVPFLIKAQPSWTGDLIKNELEKIQKISGNFLFAVADGGNAICRCLRLSQITHIYDITHKIAWILKQIYKDHPDFIAYTKEMSKMRTKLVLSDVSHILPPNQRTDSRFMNLDILSDWGTKVLTFLQEKKKQTKEYPKLKWVKKYSELIFELTQINTIVAEIKHVLKTNGLSLLTKEKVLKIVSKFTLDNSRIQYFKTEINTYLNSYQLFTNEEQSILCTSDIIESSFGTYKNCINNNPMIGVTNLSLVLAAITGEIEPNEVKTALEKVSMADLKKWSDENIGETNMSKRQKIFKKRVK